MNLLPNYIKKTLPPLYSNEHNTNPIIKVKYFCPWNKWTWYGIEFDGKDIFFGFVYGDFPELGYFSLKELTSVKGPWGMTIERDIHFQPTELNKIKEYHNVLN